MWDKWGKCMKKKMRQTPVCGKGGGDKIGGKVRPHYHTFENSWLTALNTEIADIYALKDKADIRARLKAYDPKMQSYLDHSNQIAGIIVE